MHQWQDSTGTHHMAGKRSRWPQNRCPTLLIMWGVWVLESLGSKPPMALIAQISDLSSAPATSFGGRSIAGECCRCRVQTGSQVRGWILAGQVRRRVERCFLSPTVRRQDPSERLEKLHGSECDGTRRRRGSARLTRPVARDQQKSPASLRRE
jgi:hypothetical protein